MGDKDATYSASDVVGMIKVLLLVDTNRWISKNMVIFQCESMRPREAAANDDV